MPKLTIVASNRDRFDPNSNATKWFIKSLQWQTYKDFEILLADGFSKNYEEIKAFLENYGGDIPMRIVQFPIGEAFERARLNNVGIRNALGEYVMTTDVDMLYGRGLIKELMDNVGDNCVIESRTMYLKLPLMEKIYSGALDPYNDLDSIKGGRIMKRSTAGGLCCMANKKDKGWQLVNYYDQSYIGWGTEDRDLLTRCQYAGMKIKWIGESRELIQLFHQAHNKISIKKDLEYQEQNKKIFAKLERERYYRANPNGLGMDNVTT